MVVSNLFRAAFFAYWSAMSFPEMPKWKGIQRNVTALLLSFIKLFIFFLSQHWFTIALWRFSNELHEFDAITYEQLGESLVSSIARRSKNALNSNIMYVLYISLHVSYIFGISTRLGPRQSSFKKKKKRSSYADIVFIQSSPRVRLASSFTILWHFHWFVVFLVVEGTPRQVKLYITNNWLQLVNWSQVLSGTSA